MPRYKYAKPKPKPVKPPKSTMYLSHGTSLTVSSGMFAQLVHRTEQTPGISRSDHILTALVHFLETQPRTPLSKARLQHPPDNLPKRDRCLSFRYPNEDLRHMTTAYARKHKLQLSAVVRRALYEYMKDDLAHLPEEVQVRAAFDGWGDKMEPVKKPAHLSIQEGFNLAAPIPEKRGRGRPRIYPLRIEGGLD